jgi:hypothetical protein
LRTDGDFRSNRFFTRAEPVAAVKFVQHCVAYGEWGWFYETLSKKTRDNIPYIGFWIEIESIKWPETDKYLVDMIRTAKILGVYEKNPGEGADFERVGLMSENVFVRMWLVKEDGRWRFALWEMLDKIKKDGRLDER